MSESELQYLRRRERELQSELTRVRKLIETEVARIEEPELQRKREAEQIAQKAARIKTAQLAAKFTQIAAKDVSIGEEDKLLVNTADGGLLIQITWNRMQYMTKVLPPSKWSENEFFAEAEMQQRLGENPNIVKVYGFVALRPELEGWNYARPPPYGLVMEYPQKGTVHNFFKKQNDWEMQPGQKHYHFVVAIARDVARAMSYVHNLDEKGKPIGRNLMASRVLLGEGLIAKLWDFSLATSVEETFRGQGDPFDIHYTPPEILLGIAKQPGEEVSYLQAADIWSFGLFLLEICTGKYRFPWGEDIKKRPKPMELIKIFQKKTAIPIPEECHATMKQIIEGCLRYNPKARMPFRRLEELLDVHHAEVKT